MKKIVALYTFAYLLALGGCNTMAGFGEDVQKGGEKIEDAAKKKS